MSLAVFYKDPDFITGCYIVAFALFIFGLHLMRHPRSARPGNLTAAAGMTIAFVATMLDPEVADYGWIVIGIAVGTVVGIPSARMVKMTAMPQMVALFNGVGGGAAALIAWTEFRRFGGDVPTEIIVPGLISAVIGSVSFWGSNVAFAKLQELIGGRPYMLPGQFMINGLLLAAALAGSVAIAGGSESETLFVGILVVSAILGIELVMPIGGADMPVVISMLNAFTGLAAAAAGIALDNVALIVAGTLVGASGSILTQQMSIAMNRSLANVLFAGFGGGAPSGVMAGVPEGATVRSTTAADVAIMLSYAQSVVFVPGYGMAVAQAQHAVRELADELDKRGIEVNYAIHPVAGRMPGHMNVLLAEADVPYDQLKEMDEINPYFPRTDVAVVIGANDVTNPAAKNNPDSPIYGMPILEVDAAENVVVIKRSMNPGFAGIENELYYEDKTQMLFGDGKEAVMDIAAELGKL